MTASGPTSMPAAEVEIDEALVRGLLRAERPELAAAPLVPVASGWDNAVWRLGDDLSVRVPRRALAVPLLEHEQRWLPGLAARLPLPVPVPVHAGSPTADYPWPWSICRWVPGRRLPDAPRVRYDQVARDLGRFLVALHRAAPPDAPRNPYRGVPLHQLDAQVRERARRLRDRVDVPALLDLWEEALAAPAWPHPPTWVHGDLHPLNVLAEDGTLSGILDFGDVTAGDPATDLAAAWTLLPSEAREAFVEGVGADPATMARARGWAVNHGLACLAASADAPIIAAIGRTTIVRRLLGGG